MLGRQQIAGVPTAISELFKNAHDAYAARVEVDFFRSAGLFLLRDDGVGMTRQEFEDRWLVLGTESKTGATRMTLPYRPHDVPTRPVLGEKGIGRLAIGAIGPQVLVLTRAIREEGLGDLVVGFVNWRLFELPGITLDDIEVPVEVMTGGELPSSDDIEQLVDVSLGTFASLQSRGFSIPDSVAEELASFASSVDPARLGASLDEGPSLVGDGHGTHFLILPTTETLATDIDAGRTTTDTAPPLTKFLLGFTNTMTPSAQAPSIVPRFRDWRTDDAPDELIADSEFFTPQEFEEADHHITGAFNELGQFEGSVAIYGRPPVKHVVAFPGARGARTACGPFRLEVAVVQGNPNETRVDRELWAQLTQKMARIGGLYIYRDGIRVLPYGNNDYDFIDIERNRTKSATRYYFSYRRMFGVVELDGRKNAELQEKAGREGFRENRAYGQFREILKNFFVQTAVDFFREEGSASDAWTEERIRLQEADAERQRQERLRSQRRREFQARLSGLMEDAAGGSPEEEVAEVLAQGESEMRAAAAIRDPGAASAAFVRAEQHARHALERVRQNYRIRPPMKLGLSKSVRRDWADYRETLGRLDDALFEPASEQLALSAERLAAEFDVATDRRIRLDEGVRGVTGSARSEIRSQAALVRSRVDEVLGAAREALATLLREVDLTAEQVLVDASSTDVAALDELDFDRRRSALEDRVVRSLEEKQERFEKITFRLDQLSRELMAEPGPDLDELDQDELVALRERAETDLELMQLGSAIQVINHEFLANVKAIRTNLRRLQRWADRNAGLARVYRDLRASFDHLDGYLQLFTPLQRRMQRTATNISGGEIERFLRDLFEERLERHDVNFLATAEFQTHRFFGYPSTFFPVFVNLVDNAIWWVKDSSQRVIRLTAADGVMAVCDSGPGVPDRDVDEIFGWGFSRKPAGRGTGLYVSRQVLRREGFDLRVRRDEDLGGAAFDIVRMPDSEPEAEEPGAGHDV